LNERNNVLTKQVGYPPFFSEDPSLTCQKILHWKKTFSIPPEANLSPAAIDLLKKLICDASIQVYLYRLKI